MLEVTREASAQQLSDWRIAAEVVAAKGKIQHQRHLTIHLTASLFELLVNDALIDAACGVDGHKVQV